MRTFETTFFEHVAQQLPCRDQPVLTRHPANVEAAHRVVVARGGGAGPHGLRDDRVRQGDCQYGVLLSRLGRLRGHQATAAGQPAFLQFPVLPVGHCVIVLRGPKVASAVWCSATLSG